MLNHYISHSKKTPTYKSGIHLFSILNTINDKFCKGSNQKPRRSTRVTSKFWTMNLNVKYPKALATRNVFVSFTLLYITKNTNLLPFHSTYQ